MGFRVLNYQKMHNKKTKEDKMNIDEILKKDKIRVLAVESSCDETAISIVENGREILSNVIATQIEIHKRFGGVVPEVASRNHIMAISSVYEKALADANLTIDDVDVIAVTYGAGLVGALLVGVEFAKALAYATKKPLVGVSHIRGHIAANYLSHKELKPPFMCLMVSGGHSAIILVEDYLKHTLVGTTVDDAAGEAFDKVARVLGLPYPGGPVVDKLAKEGNANINFVPKGILKGTLNFSFSGVKTAVINYVHKKTQNNEEICKEDVCASFQKCVVDELVNKTVEAAKKYGVDKIVVAGGVGANSELKAKMKELCEQNNITHYSPILSLCTDNAAMIASHGYYMFR